MQHRSFPFGLSSTSLVILIAAAVKFGLHLYIAPGYGFFGDELYTIALSRHLAFGYVDLPPLVPALVALSRAVLGESLFAMHIIPALAGAITLVLICLMTKEFGGKTFAVGLSALAFIAGPLWLALDSIFCYDSIDQMILAGFLLVLIRYLKTGDKRLWIALGAIAGLACMTKMTLPFWGPGFLLALLVSKYRKDLLSPWPWLGAALCVLIVSPYFFWQMANHWPTLDYWSSYGSIRTYEASIPQFLINIFLPANPFLLPFWLAGFYVFIRRSKEPQYQFPAILFLVTLVLLFTLHATARLFLALFMPIIDGCAAFIEEKLGGFRWEKGVKSLVAAYLLIAGLLMIPSTLPLLPIDLREQGFLDVTKPWDRSIREFNGINFGGSFTLSGRLGWDDLVEAIAGVYNHLPEEERPITGIYADHYMQAGAVDQLGGRYGLPHAVSGSLTYYLWGPGYSWEEMILVTGRTNPMGVFFDTCELKAEVKPKYDQVFYGRTFIFVCKKPKVTAEDIWSSAKNYR